ncbi:MAG TPA: hypothetical protein PLI19_01210 [Erysipelotrichaceae bacterium]|nr:hypothetical protein [Erysipelotrichaceae bacterium]HQB31925.1 hypothetical protein [Erysipelotrichaceae bacterium]
MAIYDVLSSYGQFDSLVSFNGPVEDYLKIYPADENRELFKMMLKQNRQIRVYTNFGLKFNLALIANKKIGYKDVGKIDEYCLKVPYIIYWKEENIQRALVISLNSYIEAKGIYYCLTEVDNYFENDKNDLVTIHLSQKNSSEVIETFSSMLAENQTALAIQKNLDSKYISDVDLMKEQCIGICQHIFDETIKTIRPLEPKQRKPYIDETVARVFIIKKALYVKYMTSKYFLNERHCGNVSQQRAFAKSYISELPIIPYFKLYNI